MAVGTDYVEFAEMLSGLPQVAGVNGTAAPAFRVMDLSAPFVEPLMSQYMAEPSAQVTFISARGASGKSALAAELSYRLKAPLWSLGEDKAVSGDALAARLSRYLGAVDPLPDVRAGHVPLLVIDAMDEARLRVTGLSWNEFMSSLAEYASAGVHLAILGRRRTVEDVWYALADADITINWYEISHFNPSQQSDYVDLRALGADPTSISETYLEAKKAVLAELSGASDAALNETFAGYPPVLDAVAALLKPGVNYKAILNDFQGVGAAETRLKVLRRILETLLSREQSKAAALAQQLSVDEAMAYSPHEQLDWLCAQLLGGPEPTIAWCPEPKRQEYLDQLASFLPEHPFRHDEGWASPVFSSYVGVARRNKADGPLLVELAGQSGLFFEFAAAEAADSGDLAIDEFQFAAIHASVLSGQRRSSTSVTSIRPEPAISELETVETVMAHFASSQGATSTTLDSVLFLSQPNRLRLTSPLANIDVDFPGTLEIANSPSGSVDLGPDVFLRAKVLEFLNASLQVSRSTSATDTTGPSVELEAVEAFVPPAALAGAVPVNELSIAVFPSHPLGHPWVRYRSNLESQDESVGFDERARRFLNKLMSLARRDGHRGERAVYVKKFEGRQGLNPEAFQHALDALVRRGVVRYEGEMVYIRDEWDRHRFDGKGREGMLSFDDKRDVWEPVVQAISEAIR